MRNQMINLPFVRIRNETQALTKCVEMVGESSTFVRIIPLLILQRKLCQQKLFDQTSKQNNKKKCNISREQWQGTRHLPPGTLMYWAQLWSMGFA